MIAKVMDRKNIPFIFLRTDLSEILLPSKNIKGAMIIIIKKSGSNSKCLKPGRKLIRRPTPIRIKVSEIFEKYSFSILATITPISITAIKCVADILGHLPYTNHFSITYSKVSVKGLEDMTYFEVLSNYFTDNL